MDPELKIQRENLLESLKEKGFSKEIVAAFSKVKREDFVPPEMKKNSYKDNALPIGEGQTISQPYTIAVMLKMLKIEKGQKVLEIGSGCCYVLALLSELAGRKGKVFGIEIRKELADMSKNALKNYKNVKVYHGNGKLGLPQNSPFDRIVISAATNDISKNLVSQLKEKGNVVAPIGKSYEFSQTLISYEKNKGKLVEKEKHEGFLFVPLI
ncbi:protein-L-isoaspartate(D-aspartate) O-methyltransferase [Candidatus Pacearchaeota archaeon]|nr:protein-L-isoaspartate(D-aspartate) O-methyltransferase [Candidatus Pacearchaeota archaeon]